MSSKRDKGPSAAWRFSIPTTVAFAAGTGLAFLVAYLSEASSIRQRSDLWLMGETQTLAEVVETAGPGGLQGTVVKEIAELARREVTAANGGIDADGKLRSGDQPVFFLTLTPSGDLGMWVGPGKSDALVSTLRALPRRSGEPFSLAVPGWKDNFRVSTHTLAAGQRVFLGLIDRQAQRMLQSTAFTFFWLWAGMLVFGLVVAWIAARRILQRVDAVTENVSGLGTDDLARRVPEDAQQRDEIGRLIATFNQMLSRIESGVQSIRTLSDALAHDLKSPLTAIRGNLELAMSTQDSEESRDTISRSIDNVDRLLRNLEASLDVTEAEAGALRLTRAPVDLREFVEQLVDLYRPSAEEHGLTMTVRGEGDARIDVDVNLLGRALSNLFDNALSHLHPGRSVMLHVVGREQSVAVIYQDNGPGFPPEVKDRAFQRFVKGPSSRGHGLGLAVVHAAAHAHGGHAHLGINPTGGAQIELHFPRHP